MIVSRQFGIPGGLISILYFFLWQSFGFLQSQGLHTKSSSRAIHANCSIVRLFVVNCISTIICEKEKHVYVRCNQRLLNCALLNTLYHTYLRCIALSYIVLHPIALCCILIHYFVPIFNVLYLFALYCIVLHCVTSHYIVLHPNALYSTFCIILYFLTRQCIKFVFKIFCSISVAYCSWLWSKQTH